MSDTATAARRLPAMPQRVRRIVLIAHVTCSVGWLGLDIGLLTLGITGLSTGDPQLARAAYVAMDLFGDVLIVPISLLTILTGLLLGLGTPWGLVKHTWVLLKLVTTLIAATASIFALRPHMEEAATRVMGSTDIVDLGDVGITLVVAPSVALSIYLFNVAMSVLKPFGRTSFGRRRAARGGARDAPRTAEPQPPRR